MDPCTINHEENQETPDATDQMAGSLKLLPEEENH